MTAKLLMRAYSRPTHQQGVALITVLMIFAIVAIMATDTALRMSFDIRRTHYLINDAQARQYTLGGETLGRQLLALDFEEDSKTVNNDHLREAWARPLPPFKPRNGSILLAIQDLNGRFNINNLVDDNGAINNQQLTIFKRLLVQLQLPSELANATADWLDKNTTPKAGNSEDVFYLGKELAYRSADRPIADTSELLAVEGYSADFYRQLAPHISALPETTKINVNSAGAELLSSLASGLDGRQVILSRESRAEGFVDTADFLADNSTAGLTIEETLLDTRSQFFQLWVRAEYDDRTVYLRSLVSRDPTSGTLEQHSRTFMPPAQLALNHDAQSNPFLTDTSSLNSE